jgi:pantetheine-phosphate adenylyltransferase
MRVHRTGVYAGSFDPITNGHLWMIQEGSRLFDQLIVTIGINPDKKYTFPLERRLEMVRESVASMPNVSVTTFSNRYLIHYAQSVKASHIVRGIRSVSDFEFERTMRQINGDMDSSIGSVFLIPPRDIAEISSSMVKGLIGPEGWKKVVKKYVPPPVYRHLTEHQH